MIFKASSTPSKKMILPAALIAVLGVSVVAFAQQPTPSQDGPDAAEAAPHGGPGWHHHPGGPLMHELHQLNLSDSQKASVHQILETAGTQMRAQHEAMHAQREAFMTATPGTAAYQNATTNLASAEASAASARVQEMASIRTQIYAVLTDAQRTQLATLIANRPQHPEHAPPQG